MNMQTVEDKIVGWIRKQVKDSGCQGLVVGLSGGVDSAVVGALCKKAFPDNIQGIILPCLSNPKDKEHAELVAKKFNIPINVIDLEQSFKTFLKSITEEEYDNKKHKGLEVANIKPRLRMITLYYFANKLNYLVVGTDNKSESMIGYFTKYGDGGVDILPIGNLLKKNVRKLAKHLGVPGEIIEKEPSAGLWDGQTDEDEMGITYDQLDEIIEAIEIKDTSNCDSKKLEQVKDIVRKTEHKRNMPPACKLNDLKE